MHPILTHSKRILAKALQKTGIRPSNQLHHPNIQIYSVRHGSTYGGWTVHPAGLSAKSVVYSFGIGEDASFDREIMETYGAAVFAFDPTPRSIGWIEAQEWPAQFTFYPYGIAASDGSAQFYPPSGAQFNSYSLLERESEKGPPITVPMKRLDTIAKMLGHSQIDILKMDIEGAEYAVLPDILATPGLKISQILVEFHHFFPEVSQADTKQAVQQMFAGGYDLFHVAPGGREYSFIRRDGRSGA